MYLWVRPNIFMGTGDRPTECIYMTCTGGSERGEWPTDVSCSRPSPFGKSWGTDDTRSVGLGVSEGLWGPQVPGTPSDLTGPWLWVFRRVSSRLFEVSPYLSEKSRKRRRGYPLPPSICFTPLFTYISKFSKSSNFFNLFDGWSYRVPVTKNEGLVVADGDSAPGTGSLLILFLTSL